MSKIIEGNLKHISVYKFKAWQHFEHPTGILRCGEITWRTSDTQTSSISYEMGYDDNVPKWLELSYNASDTGESYKPFISITSTECNYGGKRYWFECPKCSRRSAKLYFYYHYPYCRECLSLTYELNNRSKLYRQVDVITRTIKAEGYRQQLEDTGRYYYAGKPTRTFNSYMKNRQSQEDIRAFEKYLLSN